MYPGAYSSVLRHRIQECIPYFILRPFGGGFEGSCWPTMNRSIKWDYLVSVCHWLAFTKTSGICERDMIEERRQKGKKERRKEARKETA